MARLVQKFGGSSLATFEHIERAAQRVASSLDSGDEVVVVVSAMQGETDRLLSLASHFDPLPGSREMAALVATGEQASAALLALALNKLGYSAISLTALQAGIRTESQYEKADIQSINQATLLSFLPQHIPIVTGYQGVNDKHECTTLGRGGSDLTAVAIAEKIEADECQIFTDVDGVYSADPKVVPHASLLSQLYYPEMLVLAHSGAKVLQMRAVEYGSRFGVPVRVLSSFTRAPGTLILPEKANEGSATVVGLALEKQQLIFVLQKVGSCKQVQTALLSECIALSIDLDMLMLCPSHSTQQDIQFGISLEDEAKADQLLAELSSLFSFTYRKERRFSKLSLVGLGLQHHTSITTEVLSFLADLQVTVRMVHSSVCKISLMVPSGKVNFVCPLLYQHFVATQPVGALI